MTSVLTQGFADLVARCFRENVEITLDELVCTVGTLGDAGLLGKIETVKDSVAKFGLAIDPPLNVGGLDTPRVIRHTRGSAITSEQIREEIDKGEGFECEFKSSLVYDHKRAEFDQSAGLKDLKSDEVSFAAMKTICAFLNTDGGRLFVGVRDDKYVVGIEHDLPLVGKHEPDVDQWELHFRNLIDSRFIDGKLINGLVRCEFAEFPEGTVARISVPARRRLAFVRKDTNSDHCLFCRQGNKTTELKIFEVQEYLGSRGGRPQ